jgi:hypothetical protein
MRRLLALAALAFVFSTDGASARKYYRHHHTAPAPIVQSAPPIRADDPPIEIPLPRSRPWAAVWRDRVNAVVGGTE